MCLKIVIIKMLGVGGSQLSIFLKSPSKSPPPSFFFLFPSGPYESWLYLLSLILTPYLPVTNFSSNFFKKIKCCKYGWSPLYTPSNPLLSQLPRCHDDSNVGMYLFHVCICKSYGDFFFYWIFVLCLHEIYIYII